LETPWQFKHLNIAAIASYDDAAFVERCVGIENSCTHSQKNITGTLLPRNAEKRVKHVQ